MTEAKLLTIIRRLPRIRDPPLLPQTATGEHLECSPVLPLMYRSALLVHE
jgi:hypothetical protein